MSERSAGGVLHRVPARRGLSRRSPRPYRGGAPHALLAVPGVLFFVFFAVAPMVLAVYLSFTKWNGLGDPKPVGLANWDKLLHDDRLTQSSPSPCC